LIVDNQNPASKRGDWRNVIGWGRGHLQLSRDARESNDELGAVASTRAMRSDAATVQFNDPAGKGQADAEAALGMNRLATSSKLLRSSGPV